MGARYIRSPVGDTLPKPRIGKTYLRILPMMQFVYSRVNPIPVKSFMQAVGMPAGPLRRPLQPLPANELDRGLQAARALGLDEVYGYDLGPALTSV